MRRSQLCEELREDFFPGREKAEALRPGSSWLVKGTEQGSWCDGADEHRGRWEANNRVGPREETGCDSRRGRYRHVQREDHTKTQRKDSHLQAWNRVFLHSPQKGPSLPKH